MSGTICLHCHDGDLSLSNTPAVGLVWVTVDDKIDRADYHLTIDAPIMQAMTSLRLSTCIDDDWTLEEGHPFFLALLILLTHQRKPDLPYLMMLRQRCDRTSPHHNAAGNAIFWCDVDRRDVACSIMMTTGEGPNLCINYYPGSDIAVMDAQYIGEQVATFSMDETWGSLWRARIPYPYHEKSFLQRFLLQRHREGKHMTTGFLHYLIYNTSLHEPCRDDDLGDRTGILMRAYSKTARGTRYPIHP